MKRLLALVLALVLALGVLSGCQKEAAPTQPAGQAQKPNEEIQEPAKDDGIMKILLIGHSWGMDSAFMFPDVCKNEGVENLVFGFLYHGGCRLVQHLEFAKNNAAQYAYYEYDISKDDGWQRAKSDGSFDYCPAGAANDIYINDGTIAQTLEFALLRHDWDMVILQAGSPEAADRLDTHYSSKGLSLNLTGYIQELRDYVLSKDPEPRTVPDFAWNMDWTYPKDPSVRSDATNQMLAVEFEGSELKHYEVVAQVCKEKIAQSFEWKYIFPNGTTVQNLKSSTWENAKLYRDYGHVTDFGRWCAAYTWYCTIFDKDITDCTFAPMNHKVVLDQMSRQYQKNLELTQEQKDLMIEAVGNALAKPYEVTQSKY